MTNEEAINQLQQDVSEIRRDIAVIQADLGNHVGTLMRDVGEVKLDFREMRKRIESLIVVSQKPQNGTGWKQTVFMLAGWLMGFLMLILNYVLK